MTTKKVQVIKEYGLSISTDVEIPADAEIKDVWVKWDNMEVVTTSGVFTSEIDLTAQEIEYKRPFNIMVFEQDDDMSQIVWESDPSKDYSITQDVNDMTRETI